MFIGDYVKFLVYILSSLSQLFVLCWNGDNIIQNVCIEYINIIIHTEIPNKVHSRFLRKKNSSLQKVLIASK